MHRNANELARRLRVPGVPGTAKCGVIDMLSYFSDYEGHYLAQRRGEPIPDDATQKHYEAFLRALSKEGVNIEKLKRLQAGCEDIYDAGPVDVESEFAGVFGRQSFEAVGKLAKEFPTPRDLFSLMPENALEAKSNWTYKYVAMNETDLEKSWSDFVAWTKERGMSLMDDVDKEKDFHFDGLTIPEFQKRYPNPKDILFPVNIEYVRKKFETFDPALIDAVDKDWATVSEKPVSRDAYVKHFLSKQEATLLSAGGEPAQELLKDALDGAFDVCTQLTMPASMHLDEHAFRYCSALAYEMFLNNIPSDEC
jgi:hypothetical protein